MTRLAAGLDESENEGRGPGATGGVPFVRPDLPAYAELEEAFCDSFATGLLTKGPQLATLEQEVAAAVATKHAVGVSSCTVGLALVLKTLAEWDRRRGLADIRDEVVMPSFVFLASPGAAVWAGMRPVFAEIDPRTWTVDPEAVEAAIGPKTRAILACHTFGNPCNEVALEWIAANHGVDLVVDAAHGFGSTRDGRPVGNAGIAQVFSMSPTKLVVAGEGGIVATGDADLAHAIREAREYGNDGHYGCGVAGLNGRLPELSAAVARASLARLTGVRERRTAAAEAYIRGLSGLAGISVQRIAESCESSWKDFAVRVRASEFGCSRDQLRDHLASQGIDTRAYYSPACHQMQAFAAFHEGQPPLDETERLSDECLALPMGQHVTAEVAAGVAALIAEVQR